MRKAVMVGGALCLAAASLWAGPLGAPFRVSSCPACQEETPAVAGAPSGDFLVLWEGQSAKDLRGIDGRLFKGATATPAAADFQVNKNVAPDQYDAAVTRDNKGNYIAVWSEVANGNSEIMAQRFQATGAALGASFKVNVDPAGPIPADYSPAIARTSDGGFVVVWITLFPPSNHPENDTPQVMARRFNSAGAAVGSPIKLNTGLALGTRPDVCVDTSGKIITVWASVDAFRPFEPSKLGLSMRRLSPAGAPLAGEEIVVPPVGNYLQPAISCGTGSTFVIVWHGDQVPAQEGTDIIGQRFSRLGRKVGAAFRINTAVTGEQRNPAISHDAKGNFVVVWQESTGTDLGIFGRRYTSAGAPAGPQFEVVTELHPRYLDARVAHIGTTGNFVIVWQDSTRTIYGRRFAP